MMKLISLIVATITLAVTTLLGQGAADEVLARADFARRESHDLQQARSLYETLTARADLAPKTSAQAWLGLGHCHAVLGAEEKARLAFKQAAQGEGEAAQEAKEILATGDLNVNPQLAARVRRALDLMRTGAGAQARDAKRSLVLLGPAAIPIVAREAQVRSDDSAFVGSVVGVMSALGGEPAAKFFRDAAASDDDYYRRAVITGVSDIYQNSSLGQGLTQSPVKETIRAFLFDKDEYVRDRAFAFAFYRTELLPDAAQMIRLLESSDPRLRAKIHHSMHKTWEQTHNKSKKKWGWAPQVFGSDLNHRASYFKLLRRDLASRDADLAEAAMKALESLLIREYLLETTLPMVVDVLAPALRERREGAILGMPSNQLYFRASRFYDLAPETTLQALRDLAGAIGPLTMRDASGKGNYTTDAEWGDVIVQQMSDLLGKPLPVAHLDFVMEMAQKGYTDPRRLAKWLKQTRAQGFADRVIKAQGAIPPHSSLLRLDEMKKASDETLRRFAPLAREMLRRTLKSGPSNNPEVWGLLNLFTCGDSVVRAEILLEILREFPDLYPMACDSILGSRDSGIETAMRILNAGGTTEEDLRSRNHLFFALLFHEDSRIDDALVAAYAKGLIDPRGVQNRGGDARARDRGLSNLGFAPPQSPWGLPRAESQVVHRHHSQSHSLKEFPRATQRLAKILATGHPDAWDDALALLRRERVSADGQGNASVTHHVHSFSRMDIPTELANAIAREFEHAPESMKSEVLLAVLSSGASAEVIAPFVEEGLSAQGEGDEATRLRRNSLIAASRLERYRGSAKILDMALEDDRSAERGVRYTQLIKYWPEDKIEELLPFRESKYSYNRRNLYTRLIEELGTEAIPMILPGFQDSDSSTRLYLVQKAVQLPDERVIPALVECLLDSSKKVREAARANLDQLNAYFSEKKRWEGWTGDDEVDLKDPLGSLGRQAMKGETVAKRVAAIRSLATLGDPKALPVLVELMTDENAEVAAAAVKALDKLNRE
jgi:HEAT repeats